MLAKSTLSSDLNLTEAMHYLPLRGALTATARPEAAQREAASNAKLGTATAARDGSVEPGPQRI
jgi:hypothetical protein